MNSASNPRLVVALGTSYAYLARPFLPFRYARGLGVHFKRRGSALPFSHLLISDDCPGGGFELQWIAQTISHVIGCLDLVQLVLRSLDLE